MAEEKTWDRIARIVEEAERREEEEREVYLNEACAGNEELRRKVDSLLAADTGALPFLAEPPPSLRDEIPENALAGTTIGPCRLVEEVGRGGLGVVYRARQEEGGIERDVALKIIKRGHDTDEVLRRFELERQILAKLQHPNIATLHSAGVTEDGLSYFVMEFIDGVPIDEYCDQKKLTTTARLHLFSKICAAVQYAHRRLIVHRDLKPSNILVTEEGEPKLLDFGIAKLLKKDGADSIPLLTVAGGAPMTPEYASPEQIRGEDLTTGSDVYSLGVVLYELLAGRRPYQLPARVQREAEKVILEETPKAPSTAVLKSEEISTKDGITTITPESVASTRDGDPRKLARRLSGDLDTIVLMSLRKEPDRRYSSPENLSDDIWRHLNGLPVEAQTDSFLYRTGKFVRRNRTGVSVAAGFLLLVLGFAISMYFQQQVTALERDRAEKITELMVQIFEDSDPRLSTTGIPPTLQEVLTRGVQNLRSNQDIEPLTRAQLLHVLGKIFRSTGSYDDARQMQQEAQDIFSQHFDAAHPNNIAVLTELARLSQIQGHFPAAEDVYRKALELTSTFYGQQSVEYCEALNHVAFAMRDQGQYAEAEALQLHAQSIMQTISATTSPEYAGLLSDLGVLYRQQGNYHKSAEYHQEALELRKGLLGAQSIPVAQSLSNFAFTLDKLGESATSEELYRQSLRAYKTLLGDDHPDVAVVLNNLASVLRDTGQLEEAMSLSLEAYDISRKVLGEKHPSTAVRMNNIAFTHYLMGAYAQAAEMHRKTLDIRREIFPFGHPTLSASMGNLAHTLQALGNLEEAESLYQEVLRADRVELGSDHPDLALDLKNYGTLLIDKGEFQSAITVLEEAVHIYRLKLPGHWRISDTESILGEALVGLRRFDEAEQLLLRSYQVLADAGDALQSRTQDTRRRIVLLYEAWEKPEKAAEYK